MWERKERTGAKNGLRGEEEGGRMEWRENERAKERNRKWKKRWKMVGANMRKEGREDEGVRRERWKGGRKGDDKRGKCRDVVLRRREEEKRAQDKKRRGVKWKKDKGANREENET